MAPGAAFVLASRAFHDLEGAPFRLFCSHFVLAQERTGERAHRLQLTGGENCVALMAVIRKGRASLPDCTLTTAGGDIIRPRATKPGCIEFHAPAHGRVVLSWN